VVVDPGVGTERRLVAVEAHGQQFVAPDNGVLTYVLGSDRDYEAFVVERREHFLPEITQTFHGRDILAPVAARLAAGMPIEAVGREVEEPLKLLPLPRPIAGDAGLEVHVIHVDRFGNLVTDLLEPDLRVWQEEMGGEEIVISVGEDAIKEISETYAGAEQGELVALFGSTGRLEIAVNQGSAAERLGLERGTIVVIKRRS